MRESKDSKIFKKAFRDLLKSEIRRPEIRKEKKEFIASHFGEEPVFFLRPSFAIPVAAFAVFFVLFFTFQHPMKQVEQPVTEPSLLEVRKEMPALRFTPPEGLQEEILEGPSKAPMVDVKRVVSRVGSPMVYHKSNNGQPITIIWVFTGGQGL